VEVVDRCELHPHWFVGLVQVVQVTCKIDHPPTKQKGGELCGPRLWEGGELGAGPVLAE
jgi:hypothetical protein